MQIDFTQSRLAKVFAHSVGNKLRDEGIVYAEHEVTFSNKNANDLFLKYMFHPFVNCEFHSFFHESDLQLNELYVYSKSIFLNSQDLLENSKYIAQHLYNESIHPKISKGELYIVYIDNCGLNGEYMDAIGIFKSETKESYFKPLENNGRIIITN